MIDQWLELNVVITRIIYLAYYYLSEELFHKCKQNIFMIIEVGEGAGNIKSFHDRNCQ